MWTDDRQPRVARQEEGKPTVEDVTWAIARVTEIVYRLWYAGSLEKSYWERMTEAEAAKAAAASSTEPEGSAPSPSLD
jgi:hypothetical protein